MKLVINHDQCQHSGAFADRCLAAAMRDPLGHAQYCVVEATDDGKPELTVTLIENGEAHTLVLHDPAELAVASSEGWLAFEGA